MISIVICHIDISLLNQLTKSIQQTIGVDYELIIIDNKKNKYSIFEAYNIGIQKSTGDTVCFVHEDVIFHTQDWGKIIIQHFQNNANIGLIGVIGGSYLPPCPAPWWNAHPDNKHFVSNIQHWKNGTPPKKWEIIDLLQQNPLIIHQYSNPSNSKIADVKCIDGVFMAAKMDALTGIKFDNELLNGFHGYDTDISLQIGQRWRVVVIFDLLLEHLSDGSTNTEWCVNAIKIAMKWQAHLSIKNTEDTITAIQKLAIPLLSFCYKLQSERFSDTEIKKVISFFFNWSISFKHLNREALLLYLWRFLGYNGARIPFRILKNFVRK